MSLVRIGRWQVTWLAYCSMPADRLFDDFQSQSFFYMLYPTFAYVHKFGEITQNKGHYVVQGRWRSPILLPAATGNGQSLNVDCRTGRTTRVVMANERRWWQPSMSVVNRCSEGAVLLRQLYERIQRWNHETVCDLRLAVKIVPEQCVQNASTWTQLRQQR